jgi:hypothetical protein
LFEAPDVRPAPQGGLLDFSAAHVFRPSWREGAFPPAAGAALSAIVAAALVVRGLSRGVSFASFLGDVDAMLLLSLAALFAYWAYAIYDLRYLVDDDSLVIVWGWTRKAVPVDQVQRIVLGRRMGNPAIDGLSWRGCHVGRGHVGRFGRVQFYSAHRSPADLVYVTTPSATFAISLSDARGLARTILEAQERAAGASLHARPAARTAPAASLLGDAAGVAVAGFAVLAFLLAAGYIASRYQSLPAHLSFAYPPGYGPEHVGNRGELMRLPLTAFLWLFIGLVLAAWAHGRVRAVSYVVLAGTLFAESLYAIAAVAAVH